jgi:hypothetical protein
LRNYLARIYICQKNSAYLKTLAAALNQSKNSRYAIISKQHRLKPPPLHSTNLKEKKKVFSFLLDLKRHHYAPVTSVA